ncbi:HAD-IIB family hydrolase [Mycoplasma corogypsi]|uniref:HAD-IIB family hydrolase n=1 Tax=Mycoplasma corogypsi TaxID=2106 RepID=UPI0038735BE1
MNKYVFAFDLDGTLFTKGDNIHPETLEALKTSHSKGHYNVLATGRNICDLYRFLKKEAIKHIDYFVCSNGSLLYDVKNDIVTVLGTMNFEELIPVVLDINQKYGKPFRMDTDKTTGVFKDQTSAGYVLLKEKDKTVEKEMTFLEYLDFIKQSGAKIVQSAFRNDEAEALEVTEYAREKLNKEEFAVYLTNGVYTDINHIHTSKLTGLDYFLKLVGLTRANLITFGDSGNDIHMLEAASMSFALGNATDDAKQAAKAVIDDHNTGTIGQKLLEILASN